MYSAVLMLALTAGSESADFGRNRCNGGCSASSCSHAVSARCSSSCSHSRGGLFHRCSGSSACSSSCARSHGGGHGCSSSCHGGGLFSRLHNRCSGSACSGYVVCSSSGPACSSGAPVREKKVLPKEERSEEHT